MDKDDPGRTADRRRRERLYRVARLAERELVEEIVGAAERVVAARTRGGEPIVCTDAVSSLLAVLERASYCCSISDVARLLRVSRQRAHETARKAELGKLVELLTNPDDRRILQLSLTPLGRARLRAARSAESAWLAELLNGLDERRLATTLQVVRVIRQRLMRDERERRRH